MQLISTSVNFWWIVALCTMSYGNSNWSFFQQINLPFDFFVVIYQQQLCVLINIHIFEVFALKLHFPISQVLDINYTIEMVVDHASGHELVELERCFAFTFQNLSHQTIASQLRLHLMLQYWSFEASQHIFLLIHDYTPKACCEEHHCNHAIRAVFSIHEVSLLLSVFHDLLLW